MDKIELVLQQSQEAFQTEISRNDLLTSKAEKYLAAVGLLVSMGLVDVAGPGDQQSLSQVGAPAWLHLSALVAFALSFAATLLTLRTREYVSHPRGTGLVDSLKSRDIDDRGAQVRVAKMYLLARETNALINDQRSRLLSLGGVTLALGFVLAAAAPSDTRVQDGEGRSWSGAGRAHREASRDHGGNTAWTCPDQGAPL